MDEKDIKESVVHNSRVFIINTWGYYNITTCSCPKGTSSGNIKGKGKSVQLQARSAQRVPGS